MQSLKRTPFQGLLNVIKFNWHFYAIAFIAIIVLLFIRSFLSQQIQTIITIILLLSVTSIVTSLIVTFYVYDFSNFYTLDWLKKFHLKQNSSIINIHAGFDETSTIIQQTFNPSNFIVLDFYDPKKHTEISIKRARKNADVYPGTISVDTDNFNFKLKADYIFLLLAAHEIRNANERINFFKKLSSLLNTNGKIIIAEHLQDTSNLIAYNIGAFHFFSKKLWKSTFKSAGINSISEIKINSFITAFVLNKDEHST